MASRATWAGRANDRFRSLIDFFNAIKYRFGLTNHFWTDSPFSRDFRVKNLRALDQKKIIDIRPLEKTLFIKLRFYDNNQLCFVSTRKTL